MKGLQLIKIIRSEQQKEFQQTKVSIKGGQRKGCSHLKLANNYGLQQHKAYTSE